MLRRRTVYVLIDFFLLVVALSIPFWLLGMATDRIAAAAVAAGVRTANASSTASTRTR